MKLRCIKNSIRLRVRKSDLQQLRERRAVTESLSFGGNKQFSFALVLHELATEVEALYQDDTLSVILPAAIAEAWMDSNQVGIEVLKKGDGGAEMHLLIEKDFPCLDRQEENKKDTFWELAPEDPKDC